MALEISIMQKEDEKIIVLSLNGSLDGDTHRELKTKVAKQLEKNPKAIILELQGLEYISSMGISAILESRRLAETRNASFMMSNIPPHIQQVFNIVNALPNMRIFKNLEEADNYFMEIQKRIKEKS